MDKYSREFYESWSREDLVDELIVTQATLDMYMEHLAFYKKRWFVKLYNKIRHAYVKFHYWYIRRVAKRVNRWDKLKGVK